MDDEGKAYILTNMGSMSYQFGDIDAAEKYLSESLKLYPMPHTYAELGNVYADMGKIQEAERYWQEALKTDDAQTILNVLPSMQERYEQQQDYRSALAMSERIHQIKDSLTQTSEQATLAEIQHRYDRQVVESKYYKVLAWLFGSILLLVALSLGSLYVYRRTVRKYTSQLSAKEEIIRDAQRKIALLSNMDGEHSEEITALQKQITTLQKQTNEQLGQGMDIYNKIANGGKLSSTDNEQYLIEYYSVLRYETYSTWMKEYKDLSARLITFLILTDMGKSNSEIEEILSITNSSLRSIKIRIKAKHRHSK